MAAPADKPATGVAKPPSMDELRRRIAEERDALAADLDQLAGEVGEAADAVRRQAGELGRKARRVAPGVVGAAAALLVARGVLRRRRSD